MAVAWNHALRFLFPSICFVCNRDLSALSNNSICAACLGKVRRNHHRFKRSSGVIEWIYTPALYDGVLKEIIHAYKFWGRDYLGPLLANLLAEDPFNVASQIDCIVPIPSSFWKEIRRGFNPAGILAHELGRRWKKPVRENFLSRKNWTHPQIGLSKEKRWENARRAYFSTTAKVSEPIPRVLLVDDVCTTGATLTRCASLLKSIGIQRIFALVLARDVLGTGS